MLSLSVQDNFRRFIAPHLSQFFSEIKHDKPFDTSRITVWADTEMYNWKEDKFVWGQKRGKNIETYQVFFDGISVCYLSPSVPQAVTLREFWKGFLKAYSMPNDDPGKIFVDKEAYEERANKKKQQKKEQQEAIERAIKEKKATTQLQKEAKEIALDVVKSSSTTT